MYCFSRTFRYFIFSTLLTLGVTLALIILNFILNVRVSLTIYIPLMKVSVIAITIFTILGNINKLFAPVNKPLITRLEREKVERARQNRRREERRKNKKIS